MITKMNTLQTPSQFNQSLNSYLKNIDEKYIDIEKYKIKYDVCDKCSGELIPIESQGIMVEDFDSINYAWSIHKSRKKSRFASARLNRHDNSSSRRKKALVPDWYPKCRKDRRSEAAFKINDFKMLTIALASSRAAIGADARPSFPPALKQL